MGNILAQHWKLVHPTVRQGDFFSGPSISSAEVVAIDPLYLTDRWIHSVAVEKDGIRRTYSETDHGFGRTVCQLMERRRLEASDLLLKAGGIIACRLYPRGAGIEIVDQGSPSERIDRYSWLPSVTLVDRQHQLVFPVNSRFLPRQGEDVVIEETGHPFEEYLAGFQGKIRYQAIYEDQLSTPIEKFAKVLARNSVGDVIALEIPFEEGRLVLLPPIEGVSPAREATALADAISAMSLRPSFVSKPDWLPAYPAPSEEELRDELMSVSSRREKLEEKENEIRGNLEQTIAWKRILYTKGRFSLLPAVKESLAKLGFSVEDKPSCDLVINSDEGDAVCKVIATEKASIEITPYRELLSQVDRARTEGEGPAKGILVVGASIELDPKRRPCQFSDEVLRGCKSQRFCLITTYQLFKLVTTAIESKDEETKARIRRKLIECDGEFRSGG